MEAHLSVSKKRKMMAAASPAPIGFESILNQHVPLDHPLVMDPLADPLGTGSSSSVVVTSLNTLVNNVEAIMNSLKIRGDVTKRKKVTLSDVMDAIENIFYILRLNGFTVPEKENSEQQWTVL